MKKFLVVLVVFATYLHTFASIPIYRDEDQIVTMDDTVYMQGKIPLLILEIRPDSEYAIQYWTEMMQNSKAELDMVTATYAYSPDWTEYAIIALLFYNSSGQQIDMIEIPEIVWDRTSSNVRARDMASIAKNLPRKSLK